MNLSELLSNLYSKSGVRTYSNNSHIVYVEPILKLSEAQLSCLLQGDGQKNPDEYKQINSSTGLAVNYYKVLENTGKIENLKFEDKVSKPLKVQGGRKANLDVSYIRENVKYYIESKFLEPYYSGNEHNPDSYFNTDNYDVPEINKNAWRNLFVTAQNFKLYNFSQLCRHLMAIWRKHHKDEVQIVLQSVTWKMPDTFINSIDDVETQEIYIARRNAIEEEAKDCEKEINKFVNQIGWTNITFQCLHYNDILDDISSSTYYQEFVKRYFF